ncbi:MAG TPA: PAS domain-containing protein [Vicinamibacterales bacterium]|jgi:PAS domain S-box-containing protein
MTDQAAARLRGELTTLRNKLGILQIVLDESTDPIFSILEDGTYRYVNNAFSNPFGKIPAEIIGRKIYDVFSPEEADKRMTVVRQAFATRETIVFDVKVPLPTGDLFFITSVKPVVDERGTVASVICISKNITERKRAEEEQQKLIAELTEALAKIRTLSGLLPICASCKKIRDDHGYWTQIESYIRQHSEADFTHGLCPSCAEKLYPDYLKPNAGSR